MSKQKRKSSYPPSKRFKPEDKPLGKVYDLEEILGVLPNKINGRELIPENTDQLEQTKESGIFTQLGHSIFNRLGKLDKFNGINFSDMREAEGAYFPQAKEMIFNSALVDQGLEFIKTIAHEGTHAIDHLHINLGSSIAVPFLAKLEYKRGVNLLERENARNWYTQAQNIIGSIDFSASYGFETSPGFLAIQEQIQGKLDDLSERLNEATFDSPGFSLEDNEVLNKLQESREQITQVLELLGDPRDDKEALKFIYDATSLIEEVEEIELSVDSLRLQREAENYGINNLYYGKERLSNLAPGKNINTFSDVARLLRAKTKEEKVENTLFHKPFTEFAAHAVENIDQEWRIGNNPQMANYWENNNDGRKLLRKIVKGVYRDFRANDLEFATKYPDANNAFLDRLTQLRNYETHKNSTEEQYKEYFLEKHFEKKLLDPASSSNS